jgi:hypothetical protein
VLNHPAVTAAIIGPRTHEHLQSQLGAVELTLDSGVLDAIDDVVAPGANFSWVDAGYVPPALTSPWRRRRARR